MSDQTEIDKDKQFLIKQFEAIREEILALKERVIRIQTISISGIPLMIAAGEKYNLDFVIIVSPLITAVVVLMLCFEQNSIMRAGRYIRKYIEPNLKSGNIIAWEEFLEIPDERNRNAEKYFLSSVILTLALYYVVGAILAYVRIAKYYDNNIALLSAIFYGSIFPFYIFFVLKTFKTSTGHDKHKKS